MKKTIKILDNEFWYGGKVEDGVKMPFYKDSSYTCNIAVDNVSNQCAPVYVSSKGRYIYSESSFEFTVDGGNIFVNSNNDIVLGEGYDNLRNAYLALCKNHFYATNQVVPFDFFENPQYNTWIELDIYQNQKEILDYAHSIIENGFPSGVFMIDDKWFPYYGKYCFDKNFFPDALSMCEELNSLGFKIMLWVCPYVSPDSVEYRQCRDNGYLILNDDKTPALINWWQGYSACLDMSNPNACKYLQHKLQTLMNDYKIAGFKFDAGDSVAYKKSYKYFDKEGYGNRQSQYWAEFGEKFSFNEFRACYKMNLRPLVQRLSDKMHTWNKGGLEQLIPNFLAQGILGYRYGCADMIGGGDIVCFRKNEDAYKTFSEELLVRNCQCSALLPMMQFSVAPWRVLSKSNLEIVKNCVKLHHAFYPYIKDLILKSNNEPIVSYLEYYYPNSGYEKIIDEFMLGEKFLVAPVLTQDNKRTVVLPSGKWLYKKSIIDGGVTLQLDVDINDLPYFEKM